MLFKIQAHKVHACFDILFRSIFEAVENGEFEVREYTNFYL